MLHEQMVDSMPQMQAVADLPDANRLAADMIAQALQYCAQKLYLRDGQEALARLQEHDKSAYQYCAYSIARQVAMTVGGWDNHVRSVYVIDYDATPDDLCFACDGRALPIHMIVWTARKTHALDALLNVLDQALTQRYQALTGLARVEHLLDTQVIDDTQVDHRLGYGAMLVSIHQRPIEVWSR